jgi:WD40 repeat protein
VRGASKRLDLETVMQAAREASGNAYAPYSNFHVGAAVLTTDGTVHVWDLTTGARLRELHGHTTEVASLSLSPDGRLALSGAVERTASGAVGLHELRPF